MMRDSYNIAISKEFLPFLYNTKFILITRVKMRGERIKKKESEATEQFLVESRKYRNSNSSESCVGAYCVYNCFMVKIE